MFNLVVSNKKAIDEIIATSSKNASENVLLKTQVENLSTDKSRLISAGKSISAENETLKSRLYLAELEIKSLKHNQRDNHGCLIRNKKIPAQIIK